MGDIYERVHQTGHPTGEVKMVKGAHKKACNLKHRVKPMCRVCVCTLVHVCMCIWVHGQVSMCVCAWVHEYVCM